VAERNEEGSNNSDASLKGKKKARYTCVWQSVFVQEISAGNVSH
jgi:hypothetical protein